MRHLLDVQLPLPTVEELRDANKPEDLPEAQERQNDEPGVAIMETQRYQLYGNRGYEILRKATPLPQVTVVDLGEVLFERSIFVSTADMELDVDL